MMVSKLLHDRGQSDAENEVIIQEMPFFQYLSNIALPVQSALISLIIHVVNEILWHHVGSS
jgi:hypothetical protein